MPYVEIPSSSIGVGKAIKEELLSRVRLNQIDFNERITQLASGGNPIEVVHTQYTVRSTVLGDSVIATFRAPVAFNLSVGRMQIFTISGNTGTLSVDVLKSTTLGGTYSTILVSPMSINYSTAASYDVSTANFGANTAVAAGSFLQVKILSLPNNLPIDFRISIYGGA